MSSKKYFQYSKSIMKISLSVMLIIDCASFAINYDISCSFNWFPNLKCWVEKYKLTKTVDRHIPFLIYDNTSINGGRLLYFAPETIFRNCDIYIFNAYFLGKKTPSTFFFFCKIVNNSQETYFTYSQQDLILHICTISHKIINYCMNLTRI